MAEDDEILEEDQEEVETEDADGQEDGESVKKKSDAQKGEGSSGPSQKLVVMVLALNIVVLGAIAALVWMNLSKRQEQVTLSDIESPKGEPTGEEAGDESQESKFVKEAFTVNLADAAGSRFAKVDVEIEVADDFVREEILRLRPRIRDFIVVVLSSKTYDQIASVDGRDFLREEIRNKINGYLTKGQIKNVYFTQFIIQ